MLEYLPLPDYVPPEPGQMQMQKLQTLEPANISNRNTSTDYSCCKVEQVAAQLRRLLHTISQPLTIILLTAEFNLESELPPSPQTATPAQPTGTDMQLILAEALQLCKLLEELKFCVHKLSAPDTATATNEAQFSLERE